MQLFWFMTDNPNEIHNSQKQQTGNNLLLTSLLHLTSFKYLFY